MKKEKIHKLMQRDIPSTLPKKKASSKLKRNTIPHHHLSCNDDSKSGSGVLLILEINKKIMTQKDHDHDS